MTVSSTERSASTDYRLSATFVLRVMGGLSVLLGLVVLVTGILVLTVGLPLVVLVVVIVVGGLGIGAGGLVASRRTVVVRLDDSGYRVRWVRGAGVAGARWSDLADVVTGESGGHKVVEFRLRDGRTTTVPVEILAGSPDDFVREIRRRARGSQPPRKRG